MLTGRGGRLYLLDDRLVVKSHSFNIQPHSKVVPLQQIQSARAFSFLGIVPTGLELVLTDGQKEKFAVVKPWNWQAQIEEQFKFAQS